MSNTKWTPGPWAIAGQRHIVADPSRDGRTLGAIDEYEFDHETRMANLLLIAAAPDLYEALDLLITAFVNPHDGGEFESGEVPAVDRARAVIAKARGEPS